MSLIRIHRLLRIITLLQGDRRWSTRELMEELGISRRTLFRDLTMLQEAGIPCYHEPGNGYRIARSFFLPPINLTVSETLGLMLLGKSAQVQRQKPLMRSAISAIIKLTSTVPEPIRQACADLMESVSVDPGAADISDIEQTQYPILQRCIDEGRTCKVRYTSLSDGGPVELQLDPYILHFVARAWYVLGYSHSHKEVRTLKLSRIEKLEPNDHQRFKRPENFDVRDKIGKAWQLIPEGQVFRVELEFTPKVAQNVLEVRWHPTQKHRRLPGGGCIVSFEVDGLNEISWWICGYGDQVKVLAPAELRQRMVRIHRNAAVLNEEVSSSTGN